MSTELESNAAAAAALFGPHHPHADVKLWRFEFHGSGVEGEGFFVTDAKPNSAGGYEIDAVVGEVNGARITELWPTGQSIPQNAGYPVDNLLFAKGAQLDGAGVGFALSNGDFVNLYDYGGYFEVLTSNSAFLSEPAIQFSATPIRV